MIETPQIVHAEPRVIASIRLNVRWSEMREVMGPGLAEARKVVAAQAIPVTGAWFTHHFRRPTDSLDFEICLPVGQRVRPEGRVRPGELPAATVAKTIYRGGYEGLGGAWGEFAAWIKANSHAARADFIERYVTGPEASDDPADWRTELSWPLLRE